MDVHLFVIPLFLMLPVALLAWWLFSRLHTSGRLERGLDRKATKLALKRIKAETKKDKSDFLNTRWMRFGGGFYGLVALWTFVCIELSELMSFIANFNGFAELFQNGVLHFLIGVAVNQLQNFVTALLWFSWWPGNGGGGTVILGIAAAYAGYLGGLTLAQRGVTVDSAGTWLFALWRRPRQNQ
jgi:hypothetical protein